MFPNPFISLQSTVNNTKELRTFFFLITQSFDTLSVSSHDFVKTYTAQDQKCSVSLIKLHTEKTSDISANAFKIPPHTTEFHNYFKNSFMHCDSHSPDKGLNVA